MISTVVPYSGMVITEDVVLEPGEYFFSDGLGLVVAGEGITIDGNGAIICGRGREGKIHSYDGIGLFANGYDGVTVKNLTLRGFQTGMKIINASKWTIHNNDLSFNYTDPDYGWGDGEPFGALYLENVSHSRIISNKGNKVWNGLNLQYCNYNIVSENEMAYCTNVCLKMWDSSHNELSNNTMSHGIRISPGEVHARDSSSVLIENGSDHNKFMFNDFTYGGDGVFIRSLNGWISTGNYFEGNDASYAHNNAWEVWDPGNTFINNKGNYSSYGFWLGGSCHAVLIGNEAAYNGTRIANAPEPFGNAGIAIVNGSSSHFTMRNNHIHHNTSVGIAIGYKTGYEAYHWIIEQNTITDNETYGIYLKHANWVNLSANIMENNKLGNVQQDLNVSNVIINNTKIEAKPPVAKAYQITSSPMTGQPVQFDASKSEDPNGRELSFRWEMGQLTVQEHSVVSHVYSQPGFYRVGLTVSNGVLSDMAWFDLYVLPNPADVLLRLKLRSAELTRAIPDQYASVRLNEIEFVQSGPSVHIQSASTMTRIRLPIDRFASNGSVAAKLSIAKRLNIWMKYQHEMRNGFTHGGLTIRLFQDDSSYFQYICTDSIFNWSRIASESRYGWSLIQIPLNDCEQGENSKPIADSWKMSIIGNPQIDQLQYIDIEYSSLGGRFQVWLDEIVFI